MKLKHKKIYEWCCTEPKCTENTIGTKKKNKICGKHQTKMIIPSLVKCPDYGHRFKPRVRMCQDHNCWHLYVPAHKKIVKVAPK